MTAEVCLRLFFHKGLSQQEISPLLAHGAARGCEGFRLLVIITRSRTCRPPCCLCHETYLIWWVLAKASPALGSSYTYFSLVCADASVGCASTVGSGSRGRDGGFVSWDVPPAPEESFLHVAAEDIACPRAWLEPRGFWKQAALLVEAVWCFDLGSLTGLVQTSASPTCRAAPSFWATSTILCPCGKEAKKKVTGMTSRDKPHPRPLAGRQG